MNIASLNVVLMSNVNVKKFTLSDYPEVEGLLLLPLPISNAPDIQDND